MPGLPGAEDVTRAAYFQVAHRNLETRAQVGVLRQGFQPCPRFFGLSAWVEEVGIGLLGTPPDAPAQLVQLRHAEPIRPINDQCVGVGDVDTAFDDGGLKATHRIRPAQRPASHSLAFVHSSDHVR